MNPPQTLIIFCKAPIPGQVKTRLMVELSDIEACSLHAELASGLITECLLDLAGQVEIQLWVDQAHSFFDQFDVPKRLQVGANLGDKMYSAFSSCDGPAVLIGTDCPELSSHYIVDAFSQLAQNEQVIGPAEDGGYGLIGLQSAELTFFQDIQWGTDTVCSETCRRFNKRGENWALLPLLWDLDRPADLLRYQQFKQAKQSQKP